MKEKIALLLCLLSISLAAIATIKPVQSQTSGFAWNNPAYMGTDVSYGHDEIVGYLEGTNWNFSLMWENYYDYQINVSAIRVYFGWGKNYTYTTSQAIKSGQIYVFTVANQTPSVSVAPDNFGHGYSYEIYIHHKNSTGGSLDPWIINPYGGNHFVVLSEDHLACLNLWAKYSPIFGTPSMTLATSTPMYFTNITGAMINFTQAMMEYEEGMTMFGTGVYGAARVHLARADIFFNGALNTWSSRGTAIEDAALAHTKAETSYTNAQANGVVINAYGWLLFGLGWTFIGLGVVIYGLRKPKTTS